MECLLENLQQLCSSADNISCNMIEQYLLKQLNELRCSKIFCDLDLVASDGTSFSIHQIVFVALNKKHFNLHKKKSEGQEDSHLTKKKMVLSHVSARELKMLVSFIYGEPVKRKRRYELLLSVLEKMDMTYLLKEIGGFTFEHDHSQIKAEQLDEPAETDKEFTNNVTADAEEPFEVKTKTVENTEKVTFDTRPLASYAEESVLYSNTADTGITNSVEDNDKDKVSTSVDIIVKQELQDMEFQLQVLPVDTEYTEMSIQPVITHNKEDTRYFPMLASPIKGNIIGQQVTPEKCHTTNYLTDETDIDEDDFMEISFAEVSDGDQAVEVVEKLLENVSDIKTHENTLLNPKQEIVNKKEIVKHVNETNSKDRIPVVPAQNEIKQSETERGKNNQNSQEDKNCCKISDVLSRLQVAESVRKQLCDLITTNTKGTITAQDINAAIPISNIITKRSPLSDSETFETCTTEREDEIQSEDSLSESPLPDIGDMSENGSDISLQPQSEKNGDDLRVPSLEACRFKLKKLISSTRENGNLECKSTSEHTSELVLGNREESISETQGSHMLNSVDSVNKSNETSRSPTKKNIDSQGKKLKPLLPKQILLISNDTRGGIVVQTNLLGIPALPSKYEKKARKKSSKPEIKRGRKKKTPATGTHGPPVVKTILPKLDSIKPSIMTHPKHVCESGTDPPQITTICDIDTNTNQPSMLVSCTSANQHPTCTSCMLSYTSNQHSTCSSINCTAPKISTSNTSCTSMHVSITNPSNRDSSNTITSTSTSTTYCTNTRTSVTVPTSRSISDVSTTLASTSTTSSITKSHPSISSLLKGILWSPPKSKSYSKAKDIENKTQQNHSPVKMDGGSDIENIPEDISLLVSPSSDIAAVQHQVFNDNVKTEDQDELIESSEAIKDLENSISKFNTHTSDSQECFLSEEKNSHEEAKISVLCSDVSDVKDRHFPESTSSKRKSECEKHTIQNQNCDSELGIRKTGNVKTTELGNAKRGNVKSSFLLTDSPNDHGISAESTACIIPISEILTLTTATLKTNNRPSGIPNTNTSTLVIEADSDSETSPVETIPDNSQTANASLVSNSMDRHKCNVELGYEKRGNVKTSVLLIDNPNDHGINAESTACIIPTSEILTLSTASLNRSSGISNTSTLTNTSTLMIEADSNSKPSAVETIQDTSQTTNASLVSKRLDNHKCNPVNVSNENKVGDPIKTFTPSSRNKTEKLNFSPGTINVSPKCIFQTEKCLSGVRFISGQPGIPVSRLSTTAHLENTQFISADTIKSGKNRKRHNSVGLDCKAVLEDRKKRKLHKRTHSSGNLLLQQHKKQKLLHDDDFLEHSPENVNVLQLCHEETDENAQEQTHNDNDTEKSVDLSNTDSTETLNQPRNKNECNDVINENAGCVSRTRMDDSESETDNDLPLAEIVKRKKGTVLRTLLHSNVLMSPELDGRRNKSTKITVHEIEKDESCGNNLQTGNIQSGKLETIKLGEKGFERQTDESSVNKDDRESTLNDAHDELWPNEVGEEQHVNDNSDMEDVSSEVDYTDYNSWDNVRYGENNDHEHHDVKVANASCLVTKNSSSNENQTIDKADESYHKKVDELLRHYLKALKEKRQQRQIKEAKYNTKTDSEQEHEGQNNGEMTKECNMQLSNEDYEKECQSTLVSDRESKITVSVENEELLSKKNDSKIIDLTLTDDDTVTTCVGIPGVIQCTPISHKGSISKLTPELVKILSKRKPIADSAKTITTDSKSSILGSKLNKKMSQYHFNDDVCANLQNTSKEDTCQLITKTVSRPYIFSSEIIPSLNPLQKKQLNQLAHAEINNKRRSICKKIKMHRRPTLRGYNGLKAKSTGGMEKANHSSKTGRIKSELKTKEIDKICPPKEITGVLESTQGNTHSIELPTKTTDINNGSQTVQDRWNDENVSCSSSGSQAILDSQSTKMEKKFEKCDKTEKRSLPLLQTSSERSSIPSPQMHKTPTLETSRDSECIVLQPLEERDCSLPTNNLAMCNTDVVRKDLFQKAVKELNSLQAMSKFRKILPKPST